MRKSLSALLISTLLVSGCGASKLNPLNWFGRGQSQPVVADSANPLIPAKRGTVFRRGDKPYTGILMPQVKQLKIERVPGGAIVRATGVAQFQQPYDVKLISTSGNQPVDRTLTFELRAEVPGKNLRQGSEWTRTVTVATFLTDNELEGVRTIRVVGSQNTMSARR